MKATFTEASGASKSLEAVCVGKFWCQGVKPEYDAEIGWYISVRACVGSEVDISEAYREVPVRVTFVDTDNTMTKRPWLWES